MNERQVVWHPVAVNRGARERRQGHRGVVLWLTGLPGAGKSSIAHAVDAWLFAQGYRSYVLDGDNLRHGLCRDLDFSDQARQENIRRVAEVASLLVDAGIIVLAALVSPYRKHRALARDIVTAEDFLEIHCQCPVEVCTQRDPKGMYRRAQAGEIRGFTGVDAPYEPPQAPDLVLATDRHSLTDCVMQVISLLHKRSIVGQQEAHALKNFLDRRL